MFIISNFSQILSKCILSVYYRYERGIYNKSGEYYFDDYLSNGGKWVRFKKDRRGRSVDLVGNETDYLPEGSNIVLTIDEVLQYHVFKAVQKKVIETKKLGFVRIYVICVILEFISL